MKGENSKIEVNEKLINSRILEKNKQLQQQQQRSHKSSSSMTSSENGGTKSKILRQQTQSFNSTASNSQHGGKRNNKLNDNLSTNDDQSGVGRNRNNNQGNVRSFNNQTDNCSKDYGSKKLTADYETRNKNYSEYQEYKTRNNNGNTNSISQMRFSNQSTSGQVSQQQQRDSGVNTNKLSSRNDVGNNTIGLTTAQKALEHQNLVPKMGQINFPPLRAPQSIVNVRHPFVTEARIKQNDIGGIGGSVCNKSTNNVTTSSLQNNLSHQINDLEHNRQTFHGYNSSAITNIQNVQSLGNITSLAQYPRPDSFPQQTLASLLFSESSQFQQSNSYANQQVGQMSQYQAYDHGSFTPTQVNVNSVLPQFSSESPQISYPQYENPPPQFVQPNHYAAADLANGQFQYQAAGVGQIQDSSLYLQSLQSPLTVAEQYAAPNYAQAVRTELIPRLRRPPRFNK